MRPILSIVLGLSVSPAFGQQEERFHLGVTRSDFYVTMQALIPDTRIPLLRCGDPLVLRSCWGKTASGVTYAAADTYESKDDIDVVQAFHFGAAGVLYNARVTLPVDTLQGDSVAPASEFITSCAAMLKALGLEKSIQDGITIVISDISKAISLLSTTGEHVRNYPSAFWVTIATRQTIECRLESQWFQ